MIISSHFFLALIKATEELSLETIQILEKPKLEVDDPSDQWISQHWKDIESFTRTQMLLTIKPQLDIHIQQQTLELTQQLKYLEEYKPRQITFTTDNWNCQFSETPEHERNSMEPITLRLSKFAPGDHSHPRHNYNKIDRRRLSRDQTKRLRQFEKRQHPTLKDEFPDFRDPSHSDFFDYNTKLEERTEAFLKSMQLPF